MSMRTISTCTAVATLFVVFAACGPKQDPNATAQQPGAYPTATGTVPYGYPQQPGAYPTATGTAPYGYPQQPQTPPGAYPTATAAPTAAPAASGQMAVPGPVAFTCTNDIPCGTHHCNTQYGKCAFPCQSNTDCISPNACVMGLCVPQMPGAAPASH
jgi:hypothetical protein